MLWQRRLFDNRWVRGSGRRRQAQGPDFGSSVFTKIEMIEVSGQLLRVATRKAKTTLPPLLMFNGIGASEPIWNYWSPSLRPLQAWRWWSSICLALAVLQLQYYLTGIQGLFDSPTPC